MFLNMFSQSDKQLIFWKQMLCLKKGLKILENSLNIQNGSTNVAHVKSLIQ